MSERSAPQYIDLVRERQRPPVSTEIDIDVNTDPTTDMEDLSTEQLVELMIQDMPSYAKAYRAAFDALVEAGFTASQAFELVRARGWDLSNMDYVGG